MLGAIKLAVVANKFNLPPNRAGIDVLEGNQYFDLLSCMIRIRISTSVLRPMSSRQKKQQNINYKEISRKGKLYICYTLSKFKINSHQLLEWARVYSQKT